MSHRSGKNGTTVEPKLVQLAKDFLVAESTTEPEACEEIDTENLERVIKVLREKDREETTSTPIVVNVPPAVRKSRKITIQRDSEGRIDSAIIEDF